MKRFFLAIALIAFTAGVSEAGPLRNFFAHRPVRSLVKAPFEVFMPQSTVKTTFLPNRTVTSTSTCPNGNCPGVNTKTVTPPVSKPATMTAPKK